MATHLKVQKLIKLLSLGAFVGVLLLIAWGIVQACIVEIQLNRQQAELESFSKSLGNHATIDAVLRRLDAEFKRAYYTDSLPPSPGPKSGSEFILLQHSEPLEYWFGLTSSDVVLVLAFDAQGQMLASEVHVRTSSL